MIPQKTHTELLFVKSPYIKFVLFLLVLSFYYNLPVLKYSVTGSNELRLYDLAGIFVLLNYFSWFKQINFQINKIPFFKKFKNFAVYCTIMLFITLLFSIALNNIIWFVQSGLYLYHMWVFFLGSVMLFFAISTVKNYKKFIYFIATLVILEGLVVLAQNLGALPFLWSYEYAKSYDGFLSGTLGPNKIVLGMTMLFSLALLMATVYIKQIKLFRPYIYLAIGLAIITILISGSRTTYVSGIIFLGYFLIRNMGRIFQFSIFGVLGIVVLTYLNPEVLEIIDDTIKGRITNKIDSPEDINSVEDFTGVYDDLGAGRNYLHGQYVIYLLKNPYIIPFGIGFNNRLLIGFSAHNQYLSLINETGLLGLFFFVTWLMSYLRIVKKKIPSIKASLNGLIFAMFVSLYFGEHLYIYRPLFGLLGLFLLVCSMIIKPLTFIKR